MKFVYNGNHPEYIPFILSASFLRASHTASANFRLLAVLLIVYISSLSNQRLYLRKLLILDCFIRNTPKLSLLILYGVCRLCQPMAHHLIFTYCVNCVIFQFVYSFLPIEIHFCRALASPLFSPSEPPNPAGYHRKDMLPKGA